MSRAAMRPETSVSKTGVGKSTSADCARVGPAAESASRTYAAASSDSLTFLFFTRSIRTGAGRRAAGFYQHARGDKSPRVKSIPDGPRLLREVVVFAHSADAVRARRNVERLVLFVDYRRAFGRTHV